ncbi:MAG: PHP domain-containing protein, partial [Chloroflexi bacterium]|nr:PHP domain-containing protein [Chloroflexota bacterium]
MFTHLHVHTEFSMLDGLSRLAPLVNRAKELGMDSLAITDHGGMYGVIDFYRLAKDAGVKPIIGCEMYVASGSRFAKNPNDKSPYHMTVLAQDARGYQNLVKLVTRSHIEGFYYKPRMDKALFEEYGKGLVALSGCPTAEVPRLLADGMMKEAREAALWHKEVFGDFFWELQQHAEVPQLQAINTGLLELHRELGLPIVATNDSHYTHQQDAPLQDILICIHTNTNIQDEKRLRMADDSYYLKSPEEMRSLFSELPEALDNTQVIAEMCNLEIDFSQLQLPAYKTPNG